jgi:hypothetical protein
MKSIVQVVTLRKLHHLGPSETTDSQKLSKFNIDPLGHQTGQITPESMLHEFNHHTKHIDPSDRIEEMCTLAGAQQWLIMGHTIQGGAELERCAIEHCFALFKYCFILFHEKKLKFF